MHNFYPSFLYDAKEVKCNQFANAISHGTQAKPAPVSSEPETEDQVKKRKRDEYLAEMAKYRNTSCGEGGGKHSLVK